MKIGSIENKPQTAAVGGERKTTAASSGTPAEASTQVELSSTALAGSADGSFDAEKVKRIALAIAVHRFKVNHEVIADKLIANARELLGKGDPSGSN